MDCFEMYQGDSHKLPVEVQIKETVITDTDVSKVEFLFGHVLKTYPDDGVTYKDNTFIVELTSDDTASIPAGIEKHLQAKVHFKSGDTQHTECVPFIMKPSHFETVGGSDG